MRLRLRSRLFLLITAMIVAVLLFSGLAFFSRFSAYVRESALEETVFVQRMLAAFQATQGQELLSSCQELANEVVSAAAARASSGPARLAELAATEASRRSRYSLVMVVDTEARLLSVRGYPAAKGERLARLELVARALESEEIWGVVAGGGRMFEAAATPLMAKGSSIGALIVGSEMDDQRARSLALASTAGIVFLSAGKVVSGAMSLHEKSAPADPISTATRETLVRKAADIVKGASAGEPERHFEVDLLGEHRLVLWTPLGREPLQSGPSVMIVKSLSPAEEATRRMLGYLAGVGIAGLIVTLLLSKLAASSVVRPIRELADRLRQSEALRDVPEEPRGAGAATGLEPRADVSPHSRSSDELEALADQLERILQAIREGTEKRALQQARLEDAEQRASEQAALKEASLAHVQAIEGLAAGRLETRFSESGPSQMALLGRHLNGMAAKLAQLLAEKQRALEELRSATDRLLDAQKMEAVGRLAGGVAHDFNNLLTVMRGNIDFLVEGLGDDHPQIEDARSVRQCIVQAAGLVGQLLAFGRKQMLRPKLVNVSDLLQRMAAQLVQLAGEQIVLRMELAPDCGQVRIDPRQFEQVVRDLLSNARDASEPGRDVLLRTTNARFDVSFAAANGELKPGDYVSVEVRDSGRGMDSHVLSQIFEPFFTTKERGSDKGAGLGLATVHGTMTQSGGFITVESCPGVGSNFRLLLPRVKEPPEQAAGA